MNYIFVEFVKRIGMKKVLLLPNNTDLNRGDQALVWESIRLIEDIYNNDVYISIIETSKPFFGYSCS